MRFTLSQREQEVLELISMGYTDKEIGARLFCKSLYCYGSQI